MARMCAMRLGRLVAPLLVSLFAGCVGLGSSAPTPDSPTAATSPAPAPSVPDEAAVPEWRVGDTWIYEWTAGKDQGTRSVKVSDVTTLNGVTYYVLDTGETTQHYYTKDLHFAAGVQASRVVARMVPPQAWFVWPLRPAAQWRYQGTYEAKDTRKQNDVFTVVGIEQVTVAAGAFRTFKIMRQSSGGDVDQYWYAPAVRWYVRWSGRRGELQFDEQLRTYAAAPRTTSAPSTR